MHKAAIRCPNPYIAVTVAQQSDGRELPHSAWKRIRLDSVANDSVDFAAGTEQERAVVAFSESLDAPSIRGWPRCRIEFGRARLPSPQTIAHPRPEVALSVLI